MAERRRTKPPHEPTKTSRELVKIHTMVGTTQEDIAKIIGVDAKTLRKHYRDELDLSRARANAAIGGALFNKAKSGDTTAMIFWMKTQAGWRERQEVDHLSSDGSMSPKSAVELTDEQLAAIAANNAS